MTCCRPLWRMGSTVISPYKCPWGCKGLGLVWHEHLQMP